LSNRQTYEQTETTNITYLAEYVVLHTVMWRYCAMHSVLCL